MRHRLIASPPNQPELAVLFALGFVGEYDLFWVNNLDRNTLIALHDLLHHQEWTTEASNLFKDISEAIYILISYISASGLSYLARSRLRKVSGQHSPFYKSGRLAEEVLKDGPRLNEHVYQAYLKDFKDVIDACYIACDDVYSHLNENDISIETVFQIGTMRL